MKRYRADEQTGTVYYLLPELSVTNSLQEFSKETIFSGNVLVRVYRSAGICAKQGQG